MDATISDRVLELLAKALVEERKRLLYVRLSLFVARERG